MTWMVRCVVVALIGMMVTLAHQRGLDLVATDEDFIHVRDLPPEVAEATGFRSLGYHYKVFGMYGLDLWRWNGEFVIYQTTIDNPITRAELASGRIVLSSTSYARVDEIEGKDSVEGLESSVPWRYYCPPGLLIILGLLELRLVGRRRRPVQTALAIGGGLVVIALVLLAKSVGAAAAIPLTLGVHHLGVAGLAMWKYRREDAVDDSERDPEPQPDAARRARPPRRERRAVSQGVSRDPYREPPQPAPIVAKPPPVPVTPSAVIVEADAPAPSRLR